LTVKFTQPDASPSWEKEYEPADCPGNESVNDPGDGSNTFVMLLTTEQPDPAYREPNPPPPVPLMVKGWPAMGGFGLRVSAHTCPTLTITNRNVNRTASKTSPVAPAFKNTNPKEGGSF
jgi:hypothetical protein